MSVKYCGKKNCEMLCMCGNMCMCFCAPFSEFTHRSVS